VVRADDPTLTPYAGLAVSGELARRLRVAELIDAELAVERRARRVKVRRRGLSPGELLVSLTESQLVGGEFFDHVEDVRADRAGAPLRAVAATPSAPTMLQNAKRFRRVHVRGAERALARAGTRLDLALGRDPALPVTVDLDATQVTVFGARKRGAARSRHGTMSYAPHVAFWAERGRALTSELVGGNKERLSGGECAGIAARSRCCPTGTVRRPSGSTPPTTPSSWLEELRKRGARFTVSVPRNQAMWKRLADIPEQAWRDAIDMDGAQVAETTYRPDGWKGEPLRLIVRRVPFDATQIAAGSVTARRRKTIHPGQLALALEGKVQSVYGYSFILTDIDDEDAQRVEHFHRHRAQIEERLKEAKLGQALRHLPSGDENANRVWLTAALAALTLTAFCCDLCPAAGASGKAPEDAPLRRAARTLRRLLFNVPARIARTGRRTILHLPEGFRHAWIFQATLDAVYALPPP
jgi:hypothetical protein